MDRISAETHAAIKDAIRAHYVDLGPDYIAQQFPQMTRGNIQKAARRLGVKYAGPRKSVEGRVDESCDWPMPEMSDAERRDCVLLRSWAYPCEAGQLRAAA